MGMNVCQARKRNSLSLKINHNTIFQKLIRNISESLKEIKNFLKPISKQSQRRRRDVAVPSALFPHSRGKMGFFVDTREFQPSDVEKINSN